MKAALATAVLLLTAAPLLAQRPAHQPAYPFGAFGLGYFYLDPYAWYAINEHRGTSSVSLNGVVTTAPRRLAGYLKLRVEPRDAHVLVDGNYMGIVDDFDGALQSLALDEGAHHIQITAPGLPAAEFNVHIPLGQTITYRDDLRSTRP